MANMRPQAGDIVRRLAGVRRATLGVGIATAAVAGFMIVGLAWLCLSFLDIGLGLGGLVLRIVAVLMFVVALAALAYNLSKVLKASHSIRSYAARVGGELKEVGLDLVTLLDLAEIDNRKFGYSEVLIARAMDGIAERVRHFDLEAGVRKRALLVYSVPLVLVVCGGLLWWRLEPVSFGYSLARFNYFLGFSAESGIEIAVEPGDKEILAGSDLEVDASVKAFVRKPPSLHVLSGGEERAYAMERLDAGQAKGRARYKNTLAKIDRDIAYFVALGDEATRVFRVSVREEPRITDGTVSLSYPSYTGLAREVVAQGIWDMTVPFGTEAAFDLAANCRPDSAWVAFIGEGGRAWDMPLEVRGDSMSGSVRLAENLGYTLELLGPERLRAKAHGPHVINVVPDKSPYVRIESPGREIMLEADMIIPLTVVAFDDYGISSMTLNYEFKGGKGEIALAFNGKAQARCDYTWDVTRLDVFPGDAVSYYVVVADNDALTGPKYAKTDVYVARVPTVYELYQEIEERQDEDVASLEEVADKAEEAKRDLEEIAEEMKKEVQKETALNWEDEQAIKQNIAKQDEVGKEIDKIASSLDETLDLMNQNNLVNFEIIDKMEEIRRLLEEVASEDLARALERMREAMAQLTPEEIRAAMENLNLTQEDLLRKLDQAIQMLKRLQAQQKMEAVANLARELADGQKDANELLRNNEPDAAERKEKGLASDAARLKEMMRELADLLKAQQNPVAGEVEKASQFMEEKNVQQKMSSMLSDMAGGRTSSALEEGQDLEQSLEEMAGMLKAASDNLMNDERKQIMAALKETIDGLRDVSARQEDVLSALEEARPDVSRSELARREMVYKEALDRMAEKLFELSEKSLFVNASLGRAVLMIGDEAEAAAKDLAEGTGRRAAKGVKSTLGSLNVLVTGLMDAMEKASSCSSPSGMADAFDSLESMCSSQLGINQGTQQMLGEGEQGLSMEARAQMARLAAQQEAVKRGLEDLSGQYGDRADILGRLDDLVEEAKRVIEDLKSQRVSDETLRRQEKILTRMLDAQKSLRRREYSERRKSRPGEVYQVASPPPLSLEEREAMVRDLMYRGRGYYPPEYEELIRAYFKAISLERPAQ